jgi:hypothetical protein
MHQPSIADSSSSRVATPSRRRMLRAAAAGTLAGTLGLIGVPSARAAAANQGNQSGAAINDNGRVLFTDAVAAKVAESGAGWVHVNFRLGSLASSFQNWTETATFGYSALSLYDEVVATAQRHGLQVLGLLSNEAWQGHITHWSANSAEAGRGDGTNQYIIDYVDGAVGVLTSHFAGQVNVWEIWNEPNLAGTLMHPSNFAQLLARSYDKAKRLTPPNPDLRLISGGIASQEDARGAITAASSGGDYLRQTYAAGRRYADWNGIKQRYGSYPLDDIGQHIYIDGRRSTTGARIDKAMALLRDAYVREEGKGTPKKTHITEVGWATDSSHVTEEIQSSNLKTAYSRFRATSYVRRAYWFFLQDEEPAKLYYGLVRSDGSHKAAWDAYRQYANYTS